MRINMNKKNSTASRRPSRDSNRLIRISASSSRLSGPGASEELN